MHLNETFKWINFFLPLFTLVMTLIAQRRNSVRGAIIKIVIKKLTAYIALGMNG